MRAEIEGAISTVSYGGGAGLMAFGISKFMETPMYQSGSITSDFLMKLLITAAWAGSAAFPIITGFVAEKNERDEVNLYDSPVRRIGRKALYAGLGAASALSWISALNFIRIGM